MFKHAGILICMYQEYTKSQGAFVYYLIQFINVFVNSVTKLSLFVKQNKQTSKDTVGHWGLSS